MGLEGYVPELLRCPKAREKTQVSGGAVVKPAASPRQRWDPRAELGAVCSPWRGRFRNHPNRGLRTQPFVARSPSSHARVQVGRRAQAVPHPGSNRAAGTRPLGETLGEAVLQGGAAPGAEHPSGTPGAGGDSNGTAKPLALAELSGSRPGCVPAPSSSSLPSLGVI